MGAASPWRRCSARCEGSERRKITEVIGIALYSINGDITYIPVQAHAGAATNSTTAATNSTKLVHAIRTHMTRRIGYRERELRERAT